MFKEVQQDQKLLAAELKWVCANHLTHTVKKFDSVKQVDILGMIHQCIKIVATQEQLVAMGKEISRMFSHQFLTWMNFLPMFTAEYISRMLTKQYIHVLIVPQESTKRHGKYSYNNILMLVASGLPIQLTCHQPSLFPNLMKSYFLVG